MPQRVTSWNDARRVLICCHDAGGAEILSAWVKKYPDREYTGILAGPARHIFTRKSITIRTIDEANLEPELGLCDLILTGTSWQSQIELRTLAAARRRNVPTVSFLDHWVNYEARFRLDDETVLPDEIWTGDADAFALARTTFPSTAVRQKPNPYFESIEADFARLPPRTPISGFPLLYVCEPISINCDSLKALSGQKSYNEVDALTFFLDRAHRIAPGRKPPCVRIRLHPSEQADKYDAVVDAYRARLDVRISTGTSLMEDCHWAESVVGCGSMAMIIALLGGKSVWCSIPVGTDDCPLPHQEIRYLRDLG